MINNIWLLLTILSILLLIKFFHKRNAVWGGLTSGIIIYLLIVVFSKNEFDWYIIWHYSVIGTIIGFMAEMLGKLSDYLKKK